MFTTSAEAADVLFRILILAGVSKVGLVETDSAAVTSFHYLVGRIRSELDSGPTWQIFCSLHKT